MIEASFIAVAFLGLLHGLEPGHGWPIATLYATRSSRPILSGFLSSSIIALFHMVSSVAIVAVFVTLKTLTGFSLPYINYIAGGALIILAAKYLLGRPKDEFEDQHGHVHEDFEGEHEHEHEHPDGTKHIHKHKHAKRVFLTLWSIASIAFILGFAHEEEFALLALAVGGIDPLALMLTYALAVTVALIGVTLLSVRIYRRLDLGKYDSLIPKISGFIMLAMGVTFILGLR